MSAETTVCDLPDEELLARERRAHEWCFGWWGYEDMRKPLLKRAIWQKLADWCRSFPLRDEARLLARERERRLLLQALARQERAEQRLLARDAAGDLVPGSPYTRKPPMPRAYAERHERHLAVARAAFPQLAPHVVCPWCGLDSPAGRRVWHSECVEELDALGLGSGGWARLAELVMSRDGNRCLICGGDERLAVHHILPLHLHGDRLEAHLMRNLQTLCGRCHGIAHRKPTSPPLVGAGLFDAEVPQ